MTTSELEAYYKDKQLPPTLIAKQGEKILDVSKFVESHLRVINAHRGSKATEPFIKRLIELRDILEAEKSS